LWNVKYDDELRDYELRIHDTNYSDRIEYSHSLNYGDIHKADTEDERLDMENDNYIEYDTSFFEQTSEDDYEQIYPIHTFQLPLEFYEKEVQSFVKNIIRAKILKKLSESRANSLYRKSMNRLSIISQDEIQEVLDFLNIDWTSVDEKEKARFLDKILYYLGFEVLPLELMLNNDKYKELNHLSHPRIIAYDLNSNLILLIEELAKITREYLYKKDTIKSIVRLFDRFFPVENRKIRYIFIVNSGVSIDLEHYGFKEQIILKDEFTDKMIRIFDLNELKKDIFKNRRFKKILRKSIEFLKTKDE